MRTNLISGSAADLTELWPTLHKLYIERGDFKHVGWGEWQGRVLHQTFSIPWAVEVRGDNGELLALASICQSNNLHYGTGLEVVAMIAACSRSARALWRRILELGEYGNFVARYRYVRPRVFELTFTEIK